MFNKLIGVVMKELYITDLDGTFLNSGGEISERSAKIINELTHNGLLFTVATARTYATVTEMFKDIYLPCPLVLMNGVTIFDPVKNKILKSNSIDEALGEKIISAFRLFSVEPMLYFQNEDVLDIYYGELTNEHQRNYVLHRKNCKAKRFIKSTEPVDISGKSLVYIVSLDYYEKLKPIYDKVSEIKGAHAMFYRDTYTDCYFLEIMSDKVSKASGAAQIKDLLGVDKIIAFGDNLNDIPLFEISDESYAVSNADQKLKEIATGIIGSNDEGAVAEFILNKFNLENQHG